MLSCVVSNDSYEPVGFSKLPNSPSSDMIKSMSTFAWMKSPSVERRTVPLMPIKQCSFVRWNTAFGSRIFEWPGLLMFVRIQQMSSHRRKPHLRKQLRPISKPSELPHHKNTKLRLAAISLISSAWISSQFQNTRCCAPAAPKALPPRKYSYKWFGYNVIIFLLMRTAKLEHIPLAVVQSEWHQILRLAFLNRMFSNRSSGMTVAWPFPWLIHLLSEWVHATSDILQTDRPGHSHVYGSEAAYRYRQNADSNHCVDSMIVYPKHENTLELLPSSSPKHRHTFPCLTFKNVDESR